MSSVLAKIINDAVKKVIDEKFPSNKKIRVDIEDKSYYVDICVFVYIEDVGFMTDYLTNGLIEIESLRFDIQKELSKYVISSSTRISIFRINSDAVAI